MDVNVERHDRAESRYDLLWHERFDVPELAALLGMDCRRIEQAVYHGELPARVVNHRIIAVERGSVIAWLGGAPQESAPGA